MLCESWWLYTLLREETVILSFLAPNPIWLQQTITHASMMIFLFLTSVYLPDGIKFSCDIFIISVLFLNEEIGRKNLSCAELFLPSIFEQAIHRFKKCIGAVLYNF